MFRTSLFFTAASSTIFLILSSRNKKQLAGRRNLDFNRQWRFPEESGEGAQKADFDDRHWRLVDLPHDWGEVIGEKKISESNKLTAVFEVPYAEGTLKAVAFHENEILAEKVLHTAGQQVFLELKPDAIEIVAGTGSLAFIQATALDEHGNLSDKYHADVQVTVEGPAALIAAGPLLQGSIQDEHFSFYNGKGLIRVALTDGELKSPVLNIRATDK